MTQEKRKTAIKWLQEEIRSLRLAPKINGCGPENWADLLEIMETCLEAVHDHFLDSTKMIDHFPDTTKMVPLTINQLLELGEKAENGKKIIVYCTPLNDWCKVFKYGIMFFGTEDYRSWREVEETYGRDWLSYAYTTAHIDREAWEPCEWCEEYGNSRYKLYAGYCMQKAADDIYEEETEELNYCPKCGRPLTEDALAELEKRLMG